MFRLSSGADPLKQVAVIDQTEARKAIKLLHQAGDLIELRALESRKGTLSGYYDNPDRLVADLAQCDLLGASGIYITLNPIGSRALLARSANRLKLYAKQTTADADIGARHWLALDFDPIRPADISSSDDQHLGAARKAKAVREQLGALGWPAPVLADSGNGAHLLYRIDLPNDDAARDLIQRVLAVLAQGNDDDLVKLDRSTFNAARIWKLYGSVARKGSDLPDYPHRPARLITVPPEIKTVPRALLERLAPMQAQPAAPASKNGTSFIDRFLARHPEIVVKRIAPYRGGRRFILESCPFDASHAGSSVAIFESADGRLGFKCQHNSCAGRQWNEFRDKFEPLNPV